MRTSVTLDDELVARAQEITGITECSALLKEALTRFIRENALRQTIAGMGAEAVIPSNRSRKVIIPYDELLKRSA